MIDLDDLGAIEEADPGGMLAAVEGMPEQWGTAIERARALEGLPPAQGIAAVVVCGMGGSGIAGDVLAAVAAPLAAVPVTVAKGYDLPAFVGERTLVVAASYSGNTEETLACFDEASRRGARLLAVTTGGALAVRARAQGVPFVSPVAGLQPRAALASLAVPPVVILERMGLLPDMAGPLAESRALLAEAVEAYGRKAEANPMKRLGSSIAAGDCVPHVWGQDGPLAVAALRWRCQLNENAKIPAFHGVLPELDHNELVGYDPGVASLERLALVVLRSGTEHPRVGLRVRATLEAMERRVGSVHTVRVPGASPLAVLAAAAVAGDFASVYCALARGVDPSPVDVITALKARLA